MIFRCNILFWVRPKNLCYVFVKNEFLQWSNCRWNLWDSPFDYFILSFYFFEDFFSHQTCWWWWWRRTDCCLLTECKWIELQICPICSPGLKSTAGKQKIISLFLVYMTLSFTHVCFGLAGWPTLVKRKKHC